MAVIDMKAMRYINLLDKVSRVRTNNCFIYNNTIFFAVEKNSISRAIGPSAVNVKRIQESLGMKIKIIQESEGAEDVKRFLENVVSPIRPKEIEIKDGAVLITAGNNQNKASLIGREKRRLEELKKIVDDTFGMELKIL